MKAEKLIYIESQFSSTARGVVKNGFVQVIVDRVVRAICNSSNAEKHLRVIIVDGFQHSASVRYIMNWNYRTISRSAPHQCTSVIDQVRAALVLKLNRTEDSIQMK